MYHSVKSTAPEVDVEDGVEDAPRGELHECPRAFHFRFLVHCEDCSQARDSQFDT